VSTLSLNRLSLCIVFVRQSFNRKFSHTQVFCSLRIICDNVFASQLHSKVTQSFICAPLRIECHGDRATAIFRDEKSTHRNGPHLRKLCCTRVLELLLRKKFPCIARATLASANTCSAIFPLTIISL
jgi:hypothetical protein